MQIEFDFTRRERCALTNAQSLKQLGVSEVQRAVVFLMQTHPDVRVLDGERKLLALKIKQAEAASWLKRNCEWVKHLQLDRSVLRRSVLWWNDRRIAGFLGPKRDQLLFDFSALLEWHRQQELDDESLLAAWQRVTERDQARPSVTGRDHSMDGVSEKNSNNPSLNPSSQASFAVLETLPIETWDRECPETRLYRSLQAWWNQTGASLGIDLKSVLGAILAARKGQKTNPVGYAVKCLVDGVKPHWIVTAKQFLKKHQTAEVYTGR